MQLQLREKGYTKVFSRGQVVLFTASLEILLLRKESQWGGGGGVDIHFMLCNVPAAH